MTFRTIYGNEWSENGWRMVNRDACTLIIEPGALGRQLATAPVRLGAPAIVLGAWARWYHEHVEPVTSPVWGWSATNDVGDSNHLSGTALDINAPKYPWGARTMPADRIAKVRKGLRAFEGLIFWGADWGRADEMHYQLNGGTAAGTGAADRLAAFARRRIRDGRLIEGDTDMTPQQAQQLKEVWDQLRGPDGKGWPQLGNKTIVDKLAAQDKVLTGLTQAVADLAAAVDKLGGVR